MKPAHFPMADRIIGNVPAYTSHGFTLTRWRASWRERLSILWHGTVWLAVQGDAFPPVLLAGHQQFEIENPPPALDKSGGL